MAALGFIEILDAKGNVTERVRIDSLPVHIGRAYSNHVVVDDPYVCPAHLTIESSEQGGLIARDLESVNGLYANGRNERVATLTLGSGTQFRIGHTRLRFRSLEHPVAPTIIDREIKESRFGSPYVAALVGIVVVLLLCLESYLGLIERVTFANVVSEPLQTLSMLLVWAGLWALASRIVVSRFHFSQHSTIACGAIVGFAALNISSEWVEFLFPFIPVLWVVGLLGTGFILAALVYGHLGFASSMRRRSRLWAALSVSAAIISVSVLSDYAGRSKFSNVMEFSGVVKPLDAAWVPSNSVDRFIEASQRLKTDLDALAQKAKTSQP
jgi:FHA domain-containing protein